MKQVLTLLLTVISFGLFAQGGGGRTDIFTNVKVKNDLSVDSVFGYSNGSVWVEGLETDTLNLDTANINGARIARVYTGGSLNVPVTAVIDTNGQIIRNDTLCGACIWSNYLTQTWLTDSTDNVGIGTTNPTVKLDVVGGVLVNGGAGDALDVNINNSGDTYRMFFTNGGLSVDIDAGGSTYDLGFSSSGLLLNYAVGSTTGDFTMSNNQFNMVFAGVANTGYSTFNRDGFSIGARLGSDTSNLNLTYQGLQYQDGTQADGYVLTSDASGNATWQDPSALYGWESITDTIFTTSNRATFAQGDTITLFNGAHVRTNSQLPIGIDSLYSVTDSTLLGINEGDVIETRVTFTAETNNVNGTFDIYIDIGGTQGAIIEEGAIFPKGSGMEQKFKFELDYFTGATFLANGGKIRIVSTTGTTEIWDVNYFIRKTYNGR